MDFSVITRAAGRAGLYLSKHAPTIMVASGTVGLVATTVIASRETLRLEETIRPHINDLKAVALAERSDRYTDQDALSDRVKLYTRITVDVTKLYAPAIGLGVTSVALIAAGHGLLMKRYAVLGAAYTSLKESYDQLAESRDDLISGEDDSESSVRPSGSPYRMYWGSDTSAEWNRDYSISKMTLTATQNYYNQVLQSRGHVFLNEILDALGLERTPAGQIVGWIYGGDGDSFIDLFTLSEEVDEEDVIHGTINTAWWLDFNVDGPVYDMI